MVFQDIVGHSKPLQILHRGIMAGRVYHAYLFSGMEGIGKRLVAITMAKALNCLSHEAVPCNQCPSCHRIDKGTHPDIIPIDPRGETIKIEQMRELQRAIALKPYEARWRVIIIDSAERMTREAANAFLKTMEEPPPWTTIILVVTTAETLPPTVLSRCQRIRFNPLRQEEVQEILARHLTEKEAAWLAPLAGGSPGRALKMDRGEVEEAREALKSIFSPSVGEKLRSAHQLASREGKGRVFLEFLEGWLRDLILYQQTKEEGVMLHRDLLEESIHYAPHLKAEDLLQGFWSLHHIQKGIESHGNIQLSLEAAFLKIGGR